MALPDKERKARRAWRMREWRRLNRRLSRKMDREYRSRNKDKVRKWNRISYLRNKAVRIAYQEAYRRNKRKKILLTLRRYFVKKRYRLELEYYNKMLKRPCAICRKKSQALDHDHKTGFVRAALCHACNMGIGHLKDDVNLLVNAIKYLCLHDSRHLKKLKRRTA